MNDEIKTKIEEEMRRLADLFFEASQQAGVIADPIDAMTTCMIVMAVGMLKGYRPEEDDAKLHARLTDAVAEGLSVLEGRK